MTENILNLLYPMPPRELEVMAQKARTLTRQHFGNTISLYTPLYLSNYCSGGCAYCGFASDREQPRRKLNDSELQQELDALKSKGIEDILLLTGEESDEASFEYLLHCVSMTAKRFHNVTIESFAMSTEQYRFLEKAGCTGVTIYQETYNPTLYDELHRWGPKKDFTYRLEAPARALEAGMRTVGMGVLFGLDDPVHDASHLFEHVQLLRKTYWQAGILVSFPRICRQAGEFKPRHSVSDSFLAQIIFAFRICLPDTPLVLSTRETPSFRDGIAGTGISRMSIASRTTVGGYSQDLDTNSSQFSVNDDRDVDEFCAALKNNSLEPVFKNWDSVFTAQCAHS